MDITMLFNDDNDDELSSLAVDISPSFNRNTVPNKCKYLNIRYKTITFCILEIIGMLFTCAIF